jgi:hypothetical protein
MRVAMVVVFVLMVAAPASASNSCMSQSEARERFSTSHLYWHGPGHCWDATPVRRRSTHAIEQGIDRQVRQQISQSKWRDAMSELKPEETPAHLAQSRVSEGYDGAGDAVAGMAGSMGGCPPGRADPWDNST